MHFHLECRYNNFAGILYLEKISLRDNKMTLGELIKEINKFSFPDKKEIVKCFEEICTARNRLFHEFAKSDLDTIIDMLTKNLPQIQDSCEDLIRRINTIYAGLTKILLDQTPEAKN